MAIKTMVLLVPIVAASALPAAGELPGHRR